MVNADKIGILYIREMKTEKINTNEGQRLTFDSTS